ncbi:unnamed protein product [Malus baccata var. baccata]
MCLILKIVNIVTVPLSNSRNSYMISMLFLLICCCCWDRTKPQATLPVKADNKEKVVVLKTLEAVKIPKLYRQIYKTIVLSVKS